MKDVCSFMINYTKKHNNIIKKQSIRVAATNEESAKDTFHRMMDVLTDGKYTIGIVSIVKG